MRDVCDAAREKLFLLSFSFVVLVTWYMFMLSSCAKMEKISCH